MEYKLNANFESMTKKRGQQWEAQPTPTPRKEFILRQRRSTEKCQSTFCRSGAPQTFIYAGRMGLFGKSARRNELAEEKGGGEGEAWALGCICGDWRHYANAASMSSTNCRCLSIFVSPLCVQCFPSLAPSFLSRFCPFSMRSVWCQQSLQPW